MSGRVVDSVLATLVQQNDVALAGQEGKGNQVLKLTATFPTRRYWARSLPSKTGLIAMFLIAAPCAQAWNGTGHMTVAYVAYQSLTPQTRARVDQLLTLNPVYASWTAKTPAAQRGLVAFLSAATWPDCIKEAAKCPGYHEDGADTGDAQNIGYADKAMHKYWHYVDQPFSPAGLPAVGPMSSNAALQIPIFTAAIGGSVSDNIKSYDVAWLEHLVGDIHQPLHAASRFTKNHPKGDTGGNDVRFCNSPCDENLHAYWDDLLGTKTGLTAITRLGTKLLQQSKPQGADIADVNAWAAESFTLATKDAYASPIGADDNPAAPLSPKPNSMYRAEAKPAAEARILIAGTC